MRQTLRKHGRDNRIFGSDPIPPSQWNYVGGAGTAEPPFENGWDNAGGGLQRLRFRVTNEDQLEVEGVVTGGTAPVVTTLPDLDAHFRESVFWPGETTYAVGALGTADLAIWKLDTNGELSIAGTVASSSMGTADLDALGYIRYEHANTGDWLSVDTTTFGGPENRGIALLADIDIYLRVTDGAQTSTFLLTATTADLLVDGQIVIESTENAGSIALTTADGDITLQLGPSAGTFSVNDTQGVDLRLLAGGTFTVYDSTNTPILQMTEGSSDLHIPTGGSVIADL